MTEYFLLDITNPEEVIVIYHFNRNESLEEIYELTEDKTTACPERKYKLLKETKINTEKIYTEGD